MSGKTKSERQIRLQQGRESMQINMRMNKELATRIDKKRIELSDELQRIPSRTEVIKMALELFLEGNPKPSGKSQKACEVKRLGTRIHQLIW